MIEFKFNKIFHFEYISIIILLLIPLGANIYLHNDSEDNTYFEEYLNLAFQMIKRYISSQTNTLVIMEKCEYICEINQNYYTNLLNLILNNLNDTLSIQLYFGDSQERPWDYNLFVVDSWTTFELSLILSYFKNFHTLFLSFSIDHYV